MHKVASNTARSEKMTLHRAPKRRAQRRFSPRLVGVWGLLALALLLGVAWVDGGEEPIRAMAVPVDSAVIEGNS